MKVYMFSDDVVVNKVTTQKQRMAKARYELAKQFESAGMRKIMLKKKNKRIIKSHSKLRTYRNRMKKNPTKHEAIFIKHLKEQKENFKFQVIFGFYIADFILWDRMLMVEIDGEQHEKTKEYDSRRDEFAKKCGFSVLRIRNKNIVKDIDIYKTYHILENGLKLFKSAIARSNGLRGSIFNNTNNG